MRVTLLVAVVIAAAVVAWLAEPQIADRLREKPLTAVRVGTVSFLSGMRYRQCRPLGPARTSFPATQPRIYDLIAFTRWTGRHTATVSYVAPGGAVYTSNVMTDNNLASACGFLSVYGQRAAANPGRWHLQLSVAGHVLASQPFTIRSVGPDESLLVPAWLCARRCTIVLRNPDRTTVSRTFANYAAAADFLRRHPGAVLSRVDGGLGSRPG